MRDIYILFLHVTIINWTPNVRTDIHYKHYITSNTLVPILQYPAKCEDQPCVLSDGDMWWLMSCPALLCDCDMIGVELFFYLFFWIIYISRFWEHFTSLYNFQKKVLIKSFSQIFLRFFHLTCHKECHPRHWFLASTFDSFMKYS